MVSLGRVFHAQQQPDQQDRQRTHAGTPAWRSASRSILVNSIS
jgi:hypothetical protein